MKQDVILERPSKNGASFNAMRLLAGKGYIKYDKKRFAR